MSQGLVHGADQPGVCSQCRDDHGDLARSERAAYDDPPAAPRAYLHHPSTGPPPPGRRARSDASHHRRRPEGRRCHLFARDLASSPPRTRTIPAQRFRQFAAAGGFNISGTSPASGRRPWSRISVSGGGVTLSTTGHPRSDCHGTRVRDRAHLSPSTVTAPGAELDGHGHAFRSRPGRWAGGVACGLSVKASVPASVDGAGRRPRVRSFRRCRLLWAPATRRSPRPPGGSNSQRGADRELRARRRRPTPSRSPAPSGTGGRSPASSHELELELERDVEGVRHLDRRPARDAVRGPLRDRTFALNPGQRHRQEQVGPARAAPTVSGSAAPRPQCARRPPPFVRPDARGDPGGRTLVVGGAATGATTRRPSPGADYPLFGEQLRRRLTSTATEVLIWPGQGAAATVRLNNGAGAFGASVDYPVRRSGPGPRGRRLQRRRKTRPRRHHQRPADQPLVAHGQRRRHVRRARELPEHVRLRLARGRRRRPQQRRPGSTSSSPTTSPASRRRASPQT